MAGILFTDKESDPKTLENVLGEAIGAASVCWDSMAGTGLFDERRARDILAEVVDWVDANYVSKASFENYRLGRKAEQAMLLNALPRLVALDEILDVVKDLR